ncbi:MAG: hypothetical protein RSD38_04790, partial [Raoultibacter sp.]
TMFDIVSAMEETSKVSGTSGKGSPCVHGEEHHCPLHLSYKLIRDGLETALSSITVEGILSASDSLKEACGLAGCENEEESLA